MAGCFGGADFLCWGLIFWPQWLIISNMKNVEFDAYTKKLLLLVNFCLIVAVIGGLLLFARTGMVNNSKTRVTNTDNSKTTQVIAVGNDKIALNAEAIKFMTTTAKTHKMTGAVAGAQLDAASIELPVYQIDGMQFGLKFAASEGFYHIYRQNINDGFGNKAWTTILDDAKNAGYKTSGSGNTLQIDNELIVCRLKRQVAVDNSRAEDKERTTDLAVACLDKSYIKAIADFYQPLVSAMSSSRDGMKHFRLNSILLVRELAITPSLNDKFQSAQLQFDGDELKHLVYKNAAATWSYLTSTNQKVLSCELFNTSDIKKAYAGLVCLDKKQQTSQVATE